MTVGEKEAFERGYKQALANLGMDTMDDLLPALTPAERIEIYALAFETDMRKCLFSEREIAMQLGDLREAIELAGPEGMQWLAPAWIKAWRQREQPDCNPPRDER